MEAAVSRLRMAWLVLRGHAVMTGVEFDVSCDELGRYSDGSGDVFTVAPKDKSKRLIIWNNVAPTMYSWRRA